MVSGWDWLGVALMIPPIVVILIRLHRRWSMTLDRHIETALLQANRPCECGRPGRDTAERWTHTQRLCQPSREVVS